jgi:uncharacterized membrane protein YsdA (DUF1294 family)
MRRPLILTLAVALLLLIITAIGFILIAIQQRNHSGIGTVAGGISELSLLLVPLLSGVIGVLLTLRRIERRKS